MSRWFRSRDVGDTLGPCQNFSLEPLLDWGAGDRQVPFQTHLTARPGLCGARSLRTQGGTPERAPSPPACFAKDVRGAISPARRNVGEREAGDASRAPPENEETSVHPP